MSQRLEIENGRTTVGSINLIWVYGCIKWVKYCAIQDVLIRAIEDIHRH